MIFYRVHILLGSKQIVRETKEGKKYYDFIETKIEEPDSASGAASQKEKLGVQPVSGSSTVTLRQLITDVNEPTSTVKYSKAEKEQQVKQRHVLPPRRGVQRATFPPLPQIPVVTYPLDSLKSIKPPTTGRGRRFQNGQD